MVYDNPEKTTTSEIVVQPARRIDIYYEFLVVVILVPTLMLLGLIAYMKFRKPKEYSDQNKPSAD